MNISMFLQMAAEACPDRNALTSHGVHYTYADLWNRAQTAARLIRESGRHYVAVLDTSSPAVPVAMMGAALAGVPYVPLNYRLARQQLDALVARIQPAYLVVDDANMEAYGSLPESDLLSRDAFLDATAASSEPLEDPAADPTAIAVQLFTSGTTGTPKAAILRHEHLVSYILGSVEFMGAGEEEATLVTVPPYHIAGISAVMSSIYGCRRIVQLPDFAAAQWLELAEHERITNAFVVPTMLSRIIDHLDTVERKPEIHTLRAIAYGGGKMPVPVIERALELFPDAAFTNAYGLTETSSTITLLGPDDHREALASDDPGVRARLGSVGQPLPSVDLQIRDEEGRALEPGNAGEIYVRGPQVSGEYLERTALVDDGWFPTRDAGYVDEAGYLFLSGRADDVIVRGGENISPAEIEDVLLPHPGVVDAAAIGVPSQEWGETVAVYVVRKNEDAINAHEIQHLIKTNLRSSRVPEHVIFEEELPYNETGKLLRRVLREQFQG